MMRRELVSRILIVGLSALMLLTGSAKATDDKKADTVAELVIEQRKLAGKNTLRVTDGQTVELRWSTDEAAELHLHGYDVVAKAKPGAPGVMRFTAHATGRYPVTVHGFGDKHAHGGGHAEKAMLHLEVYPK